jgi:asparagine synthase (glutamine-hydrolysing)
MFAFVLYDGNSGEYIAVRDHMGICPLYMGWSADGSVVFASEMKALTVADYASEVSPRLCNKFEIFPPGSVYMSKERETKRWYEPSWFNEKHIGTEKLDLAVVRDTFEMAVKRRMMTDVPWGVLLSGGLDSSLVASIACRMHKEAEKTKAFDKTRTVFPAMHSFTIGLEGSPDLIAAQKVADFLGTVHHSYTFTVQEGVDAISDVIYHLETYDTTTIRSATPMFLMSRKIKSLGIKMILSGEGADELWGGYLYFHKAPNPQVRALQVCPLRM